MNKEQGMMKDEVEEMFNAQCSTLNVQGTRLRGNHQGAKGLVDKRTLQV